MTIELRQLRSFLAVAEERHFGRAAARLGIAQPGISKQIKRLEEAIGVDLLTRDRRQVVLTKAGEVLVDYARLAVEIADRAVENTRAADGGRPGLLKLGGGGFAPASFPAAMEVLREFEARFPDVRVDLQSSFAFQTSEALVRRTIDIAISYSPYEEVAPDLQFQPLGVIKPVIGMATGHRLAAFDRLAPADLVDEVLITWPRAINARFVDHVLSTVLGDVSAARIVEATDRMEILARTASGEGIAICTPAVVALGVANLEFRPLEDESAVFEYGFVWLETGVSPYVSPFVDVAREVYGQRVRA